MVDIPDLPNPSPANVPDLDTKKAFDDQTTSGPSAGRVMHIRLGLFNYGTDDKSHAASIVLSIVLLSILCLFIAFGHSSEVFDTVFNWISGTFTFVAGIALGTGASKDNT